jgi:hypothetical protein
MFKNKIDIKFSGQVSLNGERVFDLESDGRIWVHSNFYTKEKFEAIIEAFDKVKRIEFPKI